MQQTFVRFASPPPPADTIKHTISMGITLEETIRYINPGVSAGSIAEWIGEYRRLYNSGDGERRTFLFDGVKDVLAQLGAMAVPTVLVSNKGIVAIKSALARFELTRYFELIVGDTGGGPKKPDAGLYLHHIAPFLPGIDPCETVVMGDTKADLLFARNIGALACWAAYGYGIEAECLAFNPEYVVSQPSDLAAVLTRTTTHGIA